MKNCRINGLRLPQKLVAAIADGTWTATDKHWTDIFPEEEALIPQLYSAELMDIVNKTWINGPHPAFVGWVDGSATPGDLLPEKSLLIGELQGDSMIGLDYRSDLDNPSVVFLDMLGRWVVVAPDFDTFWRHLVNGV